MGVELTVGVVGEKDNVDCTSARMGDEAHG